MQIALTELLLPILLAAVCVFFASAIIWMLLPYHKKDIRFMPNEDEFTGAITPLSIDPGLYMFPNCENAKDMKNEAFQEKWRQGPWGTITIMPARPNFALNLLRTFLSYLVITILIAYIAGIALPRGAAYLEVFRVTATLGILGYCMGNMANDFFLGKPARFILTQFIDGLVFALISAGVIASMWPAAKSAIDGTLIVQ